MSTFSNEFSKLSINGISQGGDTSRRPQTTGSATVASSSSGRAVVNNTGPLLMSPGGTLKSSDGNDNTSPSFKSNIQSLGNTYAGEENELVWPESE